MYPWRLRLNFNKYRYLFTALGVDYDILVFCCLCDFEHMMRTHFIFSVYLKQVMNTIAMTGLRR